MMSADSRSMTETGESRPKGWRKNLKKARRAIRKGLRRGFGYQLNKLVKLSLVGGYVAIFVYLILFDSTFLLVMSRLDWNTITSIIFADIPVGLVLWLVLERRESMNRKLLDKVERIRAPTLFRNLEVHYWDRWDTAEYPYLHYYVVNIHTKIAYQVTDEVQDLIEDKIIRTQPRYRDLAELHRYFDANGIKTAGGYPEGDDLFR